MDALLMTARTLHFAATASLEGIFAFWCFIAQPAFREAKAGFGLEAELDRPLSTLAWASLLVCIASGVAWLFLVASQMSSLPLAAILPNGILRIVLTQTQFGVDWRLRGAICVVVAASLALQGRVWKRSWSWIGFLSSALLGATLAWAGHGAAADDLPGDWLHLPADILHLIATGAWLGALFPLALLLATARRSARPEWLEVARSAVLRFSALGITCVITLVVTGTINTWFLAGTIPALIGTAYGQLLLIKIALFAIMIAIATINRERLAPYLERIGSEASARLQAVRRLGRNATIEAGLGFLVIGIVGIIGILTPGLHTEPRWPLPFTFDYNEILTGAQRVLDVATILVLVCVAAGAIAIGQRRYRGVAVAIVGLLVFGGIGWAALRPGIVRAYPTSYYAPTQPYAAPSIGRGAPLYAANCIMCHGVSGRGNGPLAAKLPIRPADLTEEHIFAHRVGDLFWWVSNGGDRGVMPGFADKLTPDQRWDVINFVLARAAGVLSDATGQKITTTAPPPFPDFAFEQQGAQNTLSQTLKTGPVLLALFDSPASSARLVRLAAMEAQLRTQGLRIIAVRLSEPARNVAKNAAAAPPLVVNVSDDVRSMLALFRSPTDGGETELMLDRGAGVRARWTAAEPGGLADLAILSADAARVASIPVGPANHAGHAH